MKPKYYIYPNRKPEEGKKVVLRVMGVKKDTQEITVNFDAHTIPLQQKYLGFYLWRYA